MFTWFINANIHRLQHLHSLVAQRCYWLFSNDSTWLVTWPLKITKGRSFKITFFQKNDLADIFHHCIAVMCHFDGNETLYCCLYTSWMGRKSPVKLLTVICLLLLMPAISILFDLAFFIVHSDIGMCLIPVWSQLLLDHKILLPFLQHQVGISSLKFFTIDLVVFRFTKFIFPQETFAQLFFKATWPPLCSIMTSALNAALL